MSFLGPRKPRVRPRLKKNGIPFSPALSPIHKLFYRELGGLHRLHREYVRTRMFDKVPGRLGFKLSSLLEETDLQEGLICLGFSKNGQFVITYTSHLEQDESAMPFYVYRLQWWQFRPYRKLRKVSEVRLFGDENIEQDIYIAICEWPAEESKLLVYGYCVPDREEKHQCFITITASPPVTPCEDCIQLQIVSSNQVNSDCPPRCLHHSFTVNTKYELAPPYPAFSPMIYMKIDGILLLNTGDSLLAISTEIHDSHASFQLFSPRIPASASNYSCDSNEEIGSCVSFRGALDDLDNKATDRLGMRERHSSHGKENTSPRVSREATSPGAAWRDESIVSPRYCSADESRKLTSVCEDSALDSDCDSEFSRPLELSKSFGVSSSRDQLCLDSLLSIQESLIGRSPTVHASGYASSSCSSCFSGPIILQSESQCFTYSVRRYAENYFPLESPQNDSEDDLNLAYHSVLPLEVHGTQYLTMRLLGRSCPAPQSPFLVAKQLTLDIEHYLGETVRNKASWAHRYLAFTNYDLQIIDVSSETSEVIAVVFALIRARLPIENPKAKRPYTYAHQGAKQYQTSIRFIWNLKTGAYSTLFVDDLQEADELNCIVLRKAWQPANRFCVSLRRKFSIPQLKQVHVMTNETVLKGESLKIMIDRQHFVAILLD